MNIFFFILPPFMIINSFIIGLNDYLLALRLSKNWFYLGYLEIILKYRRSVIGPWWSFISTLLIIFTLSFLWSKVFNLQISTYLPYFSIGYIVWIFFSTTVLESSSILLTNSSIIKQTDIPICSYLIKNLSKNIFLFFHNGIIILLISYMYLDVNFKSILLLTIGIILFIFITFNISIIVAIISARFNDFAQLITNLVQVSFFLTPIIWSPELLKDKIWVTDLNPLYHWINIIRLPLISENYNYMSLNISLISIIVLLAFIFFILGVTYKNIPKWL